MPKNHHEDEVTTLLKNTALAKQKVPPTNLTQLQLMGLKLLANTGRSLTAIEKRLLTRFLKEAIGNYELNAALADLKKTENYPSGVTAEVVDKFYHFTYRTRSIDKLKRLEDKIDEWEQVIVREYGEDINLDKENKLTLAEFAILVEFNKTYHDLKDFAKLDILGPEERQLFNLVETIHQVMDKLDEEFKAEKENLSAQGAIGLEDYKQRTLAKGEAYHFFKKLSVYVSKHGHTFKLYQSGDQLKISHLNPEPKIDDLSMLQYFYTDIYHIKLEKLISEKDKKLLNQLYGSNWLEEVNKRYSQIEREIHDATVTQFAGLSATFNDKNFYKIAAKSLLPLSLGHTQLKKRNYQQTQQALFQQQVSGHTQAMLCSEFVGRTTIVALGRLNEQLKKELIANGQNVRSDHHIIKNPIPEREDLKTLIPERFLTLLKQQGCVEKHQKPMSKKYFKH